MKKQAIVIGLGYFGTSLARALTERDVEVLAVDRRADRVQEVASFVTEAVRFDTTDEAALAQTAPDRRDICVCAIGDESKESSIICTALLRQMGARRIIARANDALHERILRLVGAHEVVNPEREYGQRLANRLCYEQILGEMPLGEDLVITEIMVPESFVGRTLIELGLPRKHGLTVVALRRGHAVSQPDPKQPLLAGDIAIVVARPGAVQRMMERL
jgi:trk system potassium uptake protein TrkA